MFSVQFILFQFLFLCVCSELKLRKIEPRIIGGNITVIGKYPYAVSLCAHTNNFLRHWCGGSYIAEQYVLTAAHCIVTNARSWSILDPQFFRVLAGSIHLHEPRPVHAEIKLVDKFICHRDYDSKHITHDIGLIKIHEPFHISKYISFGPLPSKEDETLFNRDNMKCTVIGWGKTEEKDISDHMREVGISLVSTERCKKVQPYNLMEKTQLCAGELQGGKDACKGDSGGPLICENRIAGIVSYGNGCAKRNTLGVYTRVDYFLEWINITISMTAGDDSTSDIQNHGTSTLEIDDKGVWGFAFLTIYFGQFSK